ncbi:MAG: modified peptide precursor CbpA [Actinobacteria bacterium]|jgi:modified peptide precursor CbpA|nr:modified peptide precursor CbpA [Actinomycetota bacterium]MCL5445581.1 modified peptide precursor CbpA [Actinomycetota bacterium]
MTELDVPSSFDAEDATASESSLSASLCCEGGDPNGLRSARPAAFAYRKACKPDGTGLSHYVLIADTAP